MALTKANTSRRGHEGGKIDAVNSNATKDKFKELYRNYIVFYLNINGNEFFEIRAYLHKIYRSTHVLVIGTDAEDPLRLVQDLWPQPTTLVRNPR